MQASSRAIRRRLAAACAAGLLAAATGCAPATPAPVSPAAGPGGAGALAAPWQIPAAELDTQRLFRLRYGGPEGEGSFRLTLRLASAERYRATAVDVAGRPLWSLSVEAGSGLWLDHRGQRFCELDDTLELEAIPIGLAVTALPAMLLGRLPAPPAGAPPAAGSRLEYRDGQGRRWSARLRNGAPTTWTLYRDGEPAAWWRQRGEESILSERRRGVQVRWRQVAREPLAELPPPLVVPAEYTPGCAPQDNAADQAGASCCRGEIPGGEGLPRSPVVKGYS